MPKVSVIIPSFNHHKYIVEAIDSVLGQTFQDYEIIIIDDSSTDGSVKIIQEHLNKINDKRIRSIVFEKNRGASVTVNKGICEAKGGYISILNSDDVFIPDKLEKQVSFLDANKNVGAVFTLAEIIDDNGARFTDTSHFYSTIFDQENRSRHQWLNYFFYKCNCLCHPSILIRKECYKTVGNYDPRFAQLPDFDMWIRLCLKYEIHIIRENLIKFRIHGGGSNASERPGSKYRTIFEYAKILGNFLSIRGKDEIIKAFPEVSSVINEKLLTDADITKYAVAQLALKTTQNAHHIFAINTLYDLLGQRPIAEKLEKIANFTYKDFVMLTGKSEIPPLKPQ
jgi:glycosyltransferase involved in cell wall biosynthesis